MSLLELSKAILADLGDTHEPESLSHCEPRELHELNELSPPDRSVWRPVVAAWSIAWRQEWANRAEAHQQAGDPWNVAEWKAFQEMTS